jgi:ADP-ribose pyrophosphatase YjhB (NUDIX family)
MSWREIRPVALGAVRRGDDLLVFEDRDPTTGEQFYRLLGGGVEFGEHSRDAVVREFDEELGVDFAVDRHVGTFERVFEFDGEAGHEIWRVYEGEIVEEWPYEEDEFEFREPELDETFTARWLDVETLREDVTFYSPAVLDALESE